MINETESQRVRTYPYIHARGPIIVLVISKLPMQLQLSSSSTIAMSKAVMYVCCACMRLVLLNG
jgi:hypothetical protein